MLFLLLFYYYYYYYYFFFFFFTAAILSTALTTASKGIDETASPFLWHLPADARNLDGEQDHPRLQSDPKAGRDTG